MKKTIILLFVITQLVFGNNAISQETKSIPEIRKDNLIKLLNYRYKGGYYTFEKLFNKTVTYPPAAKNSCVVGISIVALVVDCKGEITDIKIKTPLGYGIDGEISNFFQLTVGNWNDCNDDKYTKFEIPIQFILEGTETNITDALLVIKDENPGFLCNSDEYYLKRIEKYMEKGKYKKVIPYLDVMIRRDPYNSHYYDLKKKAINGGK